MAKYRKKLETIEAVRFTGFIGNGVQAKTPSYPGGPTFYFMASSGIPNDIKIGDWIITDYDGGKRYTMSDYSFRQEFEPNDNEPSDLDDGLNCLRCGQSIAKRKVTFASILANALIRAYFVSKEKNNRIVNIRELALPNAQYARINDLVRFGLLYKDETMGYGDYGVPWKRVAEFLNNKWPVAEYFYKNPITKENEMSANRIYFRDVPSTAEVVEKCGPKLTTYIQNDITMVS